MGDFEVDGWNTAEVVARGQNTIHILNGRVVSQGKNIRLRESQTDETTTPITRGRIALEIEAAEIFFRNVEIRLFDETEATGKSK
jgi:3-keto-disaccharide hydrolase